MIDEMNDHVMHKVNHQANGTHDTAPQPFGFSKRVKLDLKHYHKHRQLLRDLSRVTLLQLVAASLDRIEELEHAAPATPPWHPITQPPDMDTTVLLAFDDGDVTAGYLDEMGWCYSSGELIVRTDLTHWSDLPAAPVHHS